MSLFTFKTPSTLVISNTFKIILKHQGPVVRTQVSANPGLNFNQGFFFLSSKELSRMIFYIFLEYPIIKL